VWLQSKLGGLRPGTRRFERARLLRDAELEESGLAPDSAPAEE
jgi:hypothetical protein